MRLFLRFVWPRSPRSLAIWTPLILVGLISCIGLSLALGFRSGLLAQQVSALQRDGPPGLPPRTAQVEGPLRASDTVYTTYGPMAVTTIAAQEGLPLDLPGIDRAGADGSILASPAVLAQLQDDWTGEIEAWLGGREAGILPGAALVHPRELVIVEFTAAVPEGLESSFYPIVPGRVKWPADTSIVILGIAVLVLPSVALARSGATVYVAVRSRRYGLLRVLGAPPRQMAVMIAADMAVPLLVGAFLGSVAYAAFMSSWGSFTVAGTSYWSWDLLLPAAYAAGLPLIVALVGLISTARMAYRVGREPLGVLRRARGRASLLSYASAAGVLAGPALIVTAAEVGDNFTLSVWLIVAGLLSGVVGLEGLSRITVSLTGRLLADRTRVQIAGSRMARSTDALLGVSATAVAVLLVVFVAFASFWDDYPSVGAFDVVATLDEPAMEDLPLDRIVAEVAAYDGVTRVVPVGRHPTADRGIYTLTCNDAPGSVELDAPCVPGNVYLSEPTGEVDVLVRSGTFPGEEESPIEGVYPVSGHVAASWIRGYSLLMVERQPPTEYGLLLVTTDGAKDSLKTTIQGLRGRPEIMSVATQDAITSGMTDIGLVQDTTIATPYLLVMATTAAAMGAVALLYAVLLFFRQRRAEFRMLRCQGATRRLLAADLAVLFAAPLVIAFGLAVASGLTLAKTYNAAFGLSTPFAASQVVPVLVSMLAVGMIATVVVAVLATRIPPLVTDPDAAAG